MPTGIGLKLQPVNCREFSMTAMKYNHYILLRAILLVAGLFLLALGISLSVKADLGVSPISCVPYIYSQVMALSLGEVTILFNGLFILLQMIVMKGKYEYMQLSQLFVVILLGYFIDFTLFLISGIHPEAYLWQVIALLISCALIAFGVFLIVKANLIFVPADGFVLVMAQTYKREFGQVKICLDSSMVTVGVISSIFFLHTLAGIREGTLISALMVGVFIQMYGKASLAISKYI